MNARSINVRPHSQAPGASPYRHDIDGLRAVAILLVVVYHVWVGRVSGGVDAFLMISAFFLTGTFVRRLEAQRPLQIGTQWVRTFKRLLPPAAVVLVATLAAAVWLLPGSRITGLVREVWASLFYVENWQLALNATDYYADKSMASPVQHFWSLSVQGQVFIIWPLLFVIVWLLARWSKLGVRWSSMIVFALVFSASLSYSVVTTASRQEFAYFDTGARLWEFAAGALLAVALPWIRAPRWLRNGLGWVGIAALVSCGMLLDVQGGFPGYLALWPVLSVAALMVAGSGDDALPPVSRTLATKPLVALGRDAYALYLVHWPLLIFALQLKHGESLTIVEGLGIIVLSLLLARLLTWGVDDRLRYAGWANKSNWRGLLVIALSVLLVAAPTAGLRWAIDTHERELSEEIAEIEPVLVHPGAAVFDDARSPDSYPAPPIPFAGALEQEWGGFPESCVDQFDVPLVDHGSGCSYLHTDNPELVVAVIGDSHAQQWLAPIERAAEPNGWLAYSILKGGCALAFPDPEFSDAPESATACNAWLSDVLTALDQLQPDLVISVGTRSPVANESLEPDHGESEHVPEGMDDALSALGEMGIPVVLLRDNPRFSFNAYECADAMVDGDVTIASSVGANAACGVSRGRALASVNPAEALVRPGVATVDMTDRLCSAGSCPAVIGNVFVYLDDNHVTSTYAATMAPALEPRLMEAAQRAMAWE